MFGLVQTDFLNDFIDREHVYKLNPGNLRNPMI